MTDVPELMRAIAIQKNGSPRVLKYVEFRTPLPTADEVLVKVHAATVNHTDIFHREGRFIIRKPMPHILGMDVAGEVVEVGEKVKNWNIGDRVVATFEALGRERDGAYAEYTAIPADQLRKIPDGLDFTTAASIGLAFTTAWIALLNNGKIKKADHVVVHAASSGVGTAAVQIAHWKGARVIAITSMDKAQKLREIGADVVLDRKGTDIVRQVKLATDNKGASLVLDAVGKKTLPSSIDMLEYKGRIVIVGTLSGDKVEINAMDVLMKNASIIGSFDVISEKDYEAILEHFAKGTFKPVIDSIMPLSQARAAHEKIERKESFGKIILVPDSVIEAHKKPKNWIPID